VKQEISVQSAEAFSDENVKPGAKYTCDKCGISFSQNSILRNHQCIYSGERPFRCGSCGKA
jgi:KRAB domain-containing zinc finger protein